MPVKNGIKTVCIPLYWLNACGFKRDGSALHLQRISPLQKANFWENALSDKSERHTRAEISPDMVVAVPPSQQPPALLPDETLSQDTPHSTCIPPPTEP